MIKVTVNGKTDFNVEGNSLNGDGVQIDTLEIRDNTFHIIRDNKSYNATLVSFNREEKTMVLNINGNDYDISIKDKNDLLLQQLGINSKTVSAISSIKAPMPGLIINISVAEGQEVKKGDALLILEAMKMENAIKSPRDGKIKKLHVALRQPVDKNQPILDFE